MPVDQANSERMRTTAHDDPQASPLFDTPCSSVSSVLLDKPDTVIAPDDDNHLDVNSEIIVVKPNQPVRRCRTALAYADLQATHIIQVKHAQLSRFDCITKRQVYASQACVSNDVPVRTRVLNRSSSLLGFVVETPCPTNNADRTLVLYDDMTGSYHSLGEFHLCLCQDFRRHLSNLDCDDLRLYYEQVFQASNESARGKFTVGETIRVRKFGAKFHNARVTKIDCSLIKVCFFERRSRKQVWIHWNSSIIDRSPLTVSVSSPQFSTDECESTQIRLRKRMPSEVRLKQSSKKQTGVQPPPISPSSDTESSSALLSNLLTAYYTNTLLPRFRVLNTLPSTVHKCSPQCVLSAEVDYTSSKRRTNPFLLPFECQWSIVDSRPRGYRTPCCLTLYSLDDIEQYLFRTQSKLSIKFFVDGVLNRFQPLLEIFDKKFLLSRDLSNGQENVEIPVYNDVDEDRPDNFTYITKIRPIDSRVNAALNDVTGTACCDCTDNCSDRMKCACFRKTLDQAELNADPLVIEKQSHRYTQSYLLKSTGYQRKRLLNPITSGVYECNSQCTCHRDHCSNRLVQHGLFVQLQLFKDRAKGWGLRTLHDIPRGTFICQYVGELLTSDQGNERAQTMDDKYQTSLDLVKGVRYNVERAAGNDDDEGVYVVDGRLFSNLGRYFNHSCEPNMFIQNVFIESHDLHFPNLALFARTHITAGQELTWHYNCELLPDREVQCLCGSRTCRGRLF